MNGYPLLIRSTTISRCLLVSEGSAKSRKSSCSEREAGRDNQVSYTDGPYNLTRCNTHQSQLLPFIIHCTNLKLHEHMIIKDRGVDEQNALEAMQRAQQLTQLDTTQ